jgi:hypothetical protein
MIYGKLVHLLDHELYAFYKIKSSFWLDIEEMIEHLNKQAQQFWEPYTDVIVDESLVLTKLCCPYTIIIKQKPHSISMKLWLPTFIDKAWFLFGYCIPVQVFPKRDCVRHLIDLDWYIIVPWARISQK